MVVLREVNENLYIGVRDELIIFNLDYKSHNKIKLPDVNLPSNLTKGQEEVLKSQEKNIICFAAAKKGELIAVCTNNKQVVVYDKTLRVLKNFVLNRAASRMTFTPQNDLIIADKTGDAYLYKIDNVSCQWLLGHLSMLLDVCVSDCGKYIITCDRDEKIRVSNFPNAYNIVCYCLGHTEFVTNLEICGDHLVSASGDGTIRLWNYLEGQQLGLVNTNIFVDDKSIFKQFCNNMDSEHVEVEALPITGIQISKQGNPLIAVSIYKFAGIQLYTITNQEIQFLKNVLLDVVPISFSLNIGFYIFTDKYLCVYDLTTDKKEKTDVLANIFTLINNVNISKSNIYEVTTLYKRKFDNVQEYLERKKLRLANK